LGWTNKPDAAKSSPRRTLRKRTQTDGDSNPLDEDLSREL
jgi:hypothetical protein